MSETQQQVTNQGVSRALVVALGYDAATHDVEPVPGPFRGIRVVLRPGGARHSKHWIPADVLDRITKTRVFQARLEEALDQEAERERNQAKAERVVGPVMDAAAYLVAWLAAGWKLAAGNPMSGRGGA